MRHVLFAIVGTGLLVGSAWGQTGFAPLPPVPSQPVTQPLPPSAPASGQLAPFPAELTVIDPKGVEVRGGPTMEYYATSRLRYGDRVIVLRESKDQPGWFAIKPPAGSFSWIDGRYLKVVDARTGYVEADGNGPVPVLPGSSLIDKEPNNESTRIASGFLVTLLDRP